MPASVKRRYHSQLRAESARRTRAQIREAAGRLFVEQGYVSTTIRGIAEAAGVGLRTVFSVFPDGKAQLFAEALNVALGGDEAFVPLAQRPVTQIVLEERDPRRAIALLADGAAELYERAGPLIAAYMESAGADPEMRRHADMGAAAAAEIMHEVARTLHRRGAIRKGLSAGAAGDTLLALCSPQLHHLLRHHRGWSNTRYRTWLTSTLERAVLRE